MAGLTLMPGHFKGQQSEEAENWWIDVENWCTYKKLTDREKIGLFPLLLKDSAKQWFQSIAADDRDTFEKIKEAFATQYQRNNIYKWKDSAAVWSTVQGDNQSVEDYFTEVLKKAQRANLSNEQTRYSLINGLHKNIRQMVLQHEPEEIQDIKKWAMVAESSGLETNNSDVIGIIKRMEKKLDGMHVSEVEHTPYRRSGSPRVTFDETSRTRSQSPQRPPDQTHREYWSRNSYANHNPRDED